MILSLLLKAISLTLFCFSMGWFCLYRLACRSVSAIFASSRLFPVPFLPIIIVNVLDLYSSPLENWYSVSFKLTEVSFIIVPGKFFRISVLYHTVT